MQYLFEKDILVIHALILDASGGSDGVRDVGQLSALVHRPQQQLGGKDVFIGVHKKAAVYFESLALRHVFVDGNKRTAVATAARFFFLNGYEFTATNKEVVRFAVRVVVEKLELEDVAVWLKKHTKKL